MRRPVQTRRGTTLVLVLGALALISILVLVYVAIGKADRRTQSAVQNAERADEVVGSIAEYIADIVARDALATAVESQFTGVSPTDPTDTAIIPRARLMRENTDYPYTGYASRSLIPLVAEPSDRELLRFDPVGTYDRAWDIFNQLTAFGLPGGDYRTPSDPWLASIEPVDLFGAPGMANFQHLNRYDWAQISNIAPDGLFVNLFNLRGNFNAEPGLSSVLGADLDGETGRRMSDGLRLGLRSPDSGDVTLGMTTPWGVGFSGNSITSQRLQNTPGVWNQLQIGAFRPMEDGVSWDDPDKLAYQWADADGDGFADSRWFQMTDWTDPDNPNSLLPASPYKVVAAARIIDLSGLINVNTATDSLTPPGVVSNWSAPAPGGLTRNGGRPALLFAGGPFSTRAGAGPFEADLRRLLTGLDLLEEPIDGPFSRPGFDDLVQPDPGEPGDYSSVFLTDEFRTLGLGAYNSVIDAVGDAYTLDEGLVPLGTDTLFTALQGDGFFGAPRQELSEQRGEGGGERAPLPQPLARLRYYDRFGGRPVSGGESSNSALFAVDDLAELLTFFGVNDDQTFSRLERVMAGRHSLATANNYGDSVAIKSPLRSDRPTALERRRGQQVASIIQPNVPEFEDFAWLATDVRHLLTTHSGAVRRANVPLEAGEIGRLQAREVKRRLDDLVLANSRSLQRVNDERLNVNGYLNAVNFGVNPFLGIDTVAEQSNFDGSVWSTMIDMTGSQDLALERNLGSGTTFANNINLGDRWVVNRATPPYPIATLPTTGIEGFQYWTATRALTEEAFSFYADLLLPFAAEDGAWHRLPTTLGDAWWGQKSTEAYGYRGPELALRLAGHLAVNFRDAADTDSIVTPATLLIDGDFGFTGVNTNITAGPLFPYWTNGTAGAAGQIPTPYSLGPGFPLDLDVVDGLIDPLEDANNDDDAIASFRGDGDFDPTDSRLAYPTTLGSEQGSVRADSRAINIFGVEAQPFITQVGTLAMFADAIDGAPNGSDDSAPGMNFRVIDPKDFSDDFVFEVIAFELSNPFDEPVTIGTESRLADGGYWWIEYAGSAYMFQADAVIEPGQSQVFYASNPPTETLINNRIVFASGSPLPLGFLGDMVSEHFGGASAAAPIELLRVDATFQTNSTPLLPRAPGGVTDAARILSDDSVADSVVMLWRDLAGTQDIRDDLMVDRLRDPGTSSLDIWPDRLEIPEPPSNPLGNNTYPADGLSFVNSASFRRLDDQRVGYANDGSGAAAGEQAERAGSLPAWALEIKPPSGAGDTVARGTQGEATRRIVDVTELTGALANGSLGGSGGPPATDNVDETLQLAIGAEMTDEIVLDGFDAPAPLRGDQFFADRIGTAPGVPNPYRFAAGGAALGGVVPEYIQIQPNAREYCVDPNYRGWPVQADQAGVAFINESPTLLRVGDMLGVLAIGPFQKPLVRLFSDAPGDPTASTRAQRIGLLEREWTTLGEVSAIALGYGGRADPRPTDALEIVGAGPDLPFDAFDFLGRIGLTDGADFDGDGNTTEASPTDRPVLDRGTLRTDDFVLFTDQEFSTVAFVRGETQLTPLFDSTSDQRRAFGAPAAARAFDLAVAGGELDPKRYSDIGRPMTGLININTAPLRVLRTLPLLSPPAGTALTLDPANSQLYPEWWAEAVNPTATGDVSRLGLHSTESDVAAAVYAYRDKTRVFARQTSSLFFGANGLPPPGGSTGRTPINFGAPDGGFADPTQVSPGFVDPSLDVSRFDTNQLDNNFRVLTEGINEVLGFSSVGELLALRSQPASNAANVDRWARHRRHMLDVLGTDQRRLTIRGYAPDSITPLNAASPSPSTNVGELSVEDDPRTGDAVISLDAGMTFDRADPSNSDLLQSDQIVDDVDETYAIMNAISNSVEARSDYFAAWFLVHGYRESDVQGLDQADRLSDPLVPSFRARYLMVIDRSNVVEEGDEPRVVLFRRVPL